MPLAGKMMKSFEGQRIKFKAVTGGFNLILGGVEQHDVRKSRGGCRGGKKQKAGRRNIVPDGILREGVSSQVKNEKFDKKA